MKELVYAIISILIEEIHFFTQRKLFAVCCRMFMFPLVLLAVMSITFVIIMLFNHSFSRGVFILSTLDGLISKVSLMKRLVHGVCTDLYSALVNKAVMKATEFSYVFVGRVMNTIRYNDVDVVIGVRILQT